MSIGESDSLWLQQSIHLVDPIPESIDAVACADNSKAGELLMVGEDVAKGAEKSRETSCVSSLRFLHSVSQRSSYTQSLSNASFGSMQEVDDLRARVAQLKREQLKWSGSQRELEIMRFELAQTQQELQTTREYAKAVKGQLDEAESRAELEVRARRNAEDRLEAAVSQGSKDKVFLKQQHEVMREEHSRQLDEVEGRSEADGSDRVEFMRVTITRLTEDIEALDENNTQTREEAAHLEEENEQLRANIKVVEAKCEELQRSSESHSARYTELEEIHKAFVEKVERKQAEALDSQMSMNNSRVQKIIASKDEIVEELRAELEALRERSGSFSGEVTALQHRVRALEEEARQAAQDHEKEMRVLRDQHHLALCQQQEMSENLVREARSGKITLEEENSFLKRKVASIEEKQFAKAALLVQQEQQWGKLEAENITVKNALQAAEKERTAAKNEVEALRTGLVQAEDRALHLQQQHDLTETVYSQDMLELKEKLAATQAKLLESESELSLVRQEKMKNETEAIANLSELRSKLDEAEGDRKQLEHAVQQAAETEKQLEQLRAKYLTMCKKAEHMGIELTAVTNRCSLLGRRLDEEFRRSVRNASHSPMSLHTGGKGACCLRSVASTNVPPATAMKQSKRSRSADQRVFTISGFDGTELLDQIHRLPHAVVAECKSNSPVPTNLTHSVTNGQLTIKLLTALVRGCWMLPEAYVLESTRRQQWLDESLYGFRHEKPPIAQKCIAFSEGFVSSRHHSTANLVMVEGGATVESDLDAADVILCTHSEYGNMEGSQAMTWDKLVELIYPVKVGVVTEEK